MSQTAERSSGWAAFALKQQQQRQGHALENVVDPFPPILPVNTQAGPIGSLSTDKPLARPCSSAVQPPLEYRKNLGAGSYASDKVISTTDEGTSMVNLFSKLKKLHNWADESLIEDILSAVDNDEDQATSLLKAMSAHDSGSSETSSFKPCCVVNDQFHEKGSEQEASITVENQISSKTQEKVMSGGMAVPVEPEWEEDDVYLSHRKEALRMMRLASQHSRSASNAYMLGDHFLAHQLSKKAREEWLASNELNAQAAKDILRIRNNENTPWKLDLHGLHASEAVRALEEFLHGIEVQMLCKRPSELNNQGQGSTSSLFTKPHSQLERGTKGDKQQVQTRGTSRILEIITGSGNHSRGQAALPTAVRRFLIENGYRFDEARTGVFAVRPKFRYK